MPLVIREVSTEHTPESLAENLASERGVVLLRSALFDSPNARYSFVTARPFLTFRSCGSRCQVRTEGCRQVLFGNPWDMLDSLMARFELLDELDLPFPLGGCFGYWGYELKNFVEPKLRRRAVNDLELPDCCVGFYASLVVFDHRLQKTWLIATGLGADGSRTPERAGSQAKFWAGHLAHPPRSPSERPTDPPVSARREPRRVVAPVRFRLSELSQAHENSPPAIKGTEVNHEIVSNFSRAEFLARVERSLAYIRAGDIYQVNLSQRLATRCPASAWDFFLRLGLVSPAPFSAFLNCGEFQIASSSPELFLRLSGTHVQTRPIKGTRPRSADATRDAQLAYELRTSPKDLAELVMITDLLRNDLGKVCEFGSVQVPDLACLEQFPQVQHLVSTIEGRLRQPLTHLSALAACFPGGSITGAPKFRAMEIIDELEPTTRGPYTGALGYLGFNRESQLSIVIRAAICKAGGAYFHVGAGIVADSIPAAEYDETLAKAQGFLAALQFEPGKQSNSPKLPSLHHARLPQRPSGT